MGKGTITIFSILLTFLIAFSINHAFGDSSTFTVTAGTTVTKQLTLTGGEVISGSMTVSGGSGNDVIFTVTDPKGLTLVSIDRVSVSADFNFEAKIKGTYQMDFDNSFSFFSDKDVSLTYDITQNKAPTINSPSDIKYKEGDNEYSIIWIGHDLNPDYYILSKNGNTVNTSDWSDGATITQKLVDLKAGTYTYEMQLYDTAGLSVTDSVVVTVSSNHSNKLPISYPPITLMISIIPIIAVVHKKVKLINSRL